MPDAPNADDIFSAIGGAITQWAFYEARLCDLFAVCISPSDGSYCGIHLYDPAPATAAFYAV